MVIKNALFDEFDPVSVKAWKQKIQYELKGKDYNEGLIWESPEGIKTNPFYHADDLEKVDRNPQKKSFHGISHKKSLSPILQKPT